jgi:hypothetical protein
MDMTPQSWQQTERTSSFMTPSSGGFHDDEAHYGSFSSAEATS